MLSVLKTKLRSKLCYTFGFLVFLLFIFQGLNFIRIEYFHCLIHTRGVLSLGSASLVQLVTRYDTWVVTRIEANTLTTIWRKSFLTSLLMPVTVTSSCNAVAAGVIIAIIVDPYTRSHST